MVKLKITAQHSMCPQSKYLDYCVCESLVQTFIYAFFLKKGSTFLSITRLKFAKKLSKSCTPRLTFDQSNVQKNNCVCYNGDYMTNYNEK